MNAERRSSALRALAARVRGAIHDLDALAADSTGARATFPARAADRLHVAGCGALIHSFYNELEKTFEAVARQLDGFQPVGEDWHAALAHQVTMEIPGVRPPVVPAELGPSLRELRAFRHLFRHLYVLNLDPSRIESLLGQVGSAWAELAPALERFAASLESMAGELVAP